METSTARRTRPRLAAYLGGTALTLLASACSSPSLQAAPARGEASAAVTPWRGQLTTSTPRPKYAGSTNPADPPLVITNRYELVVPMSVTSRKLPTKWKPQAWYARVTAAAGQQGQKKAVDPSQPSLGSGLSWNFRDASVKMLAISEAFDGLGRAVFIQCFAQGFEPTSEQASARIAAVFSLCASADFPGSQTSTVRAWVMREEPLVMADLRKHPNAMSITSPVPTFGTGTYWLSAGTVGSYGYTIELMIR